MKEEKYEQLELDLDDTEDSDDEEEEEDINDELVKNIDEIERLTEEAVKADEELGKTLDELDKDTNKLVEDFYGSTDPNKIFSIEAKIKRLKDQIDYIENYDPDKEYPGYVVTFDDPSKVTLNTEHIRQVISDMEDSIEMKHMKDNLKFNKVLSSMERIKSLNRKINIKLMRNVEFDEERKPLYIDLVSVYKTLLKSSNVSSFDKDIVVFTCAIGQYFLKMSTERPYYVKNIAENIVNIETFGDRLEQNRDIITSLNEMIQNIR